MSNLILHWLSHRLRLSVLLGMVLGVSVVVGIGCSASSGSTANKLGPDGIAAGVGGTASVYNVCPNGDCSNVTVTDNCDGGAIINVAAKKGSRDLLATTTGCQKTVNWGGQDAAVTETKPPPSTTETYGCPTGTTRIHIRDVWSKLANPTLGTTPNRPLDVVITDTSNAWITTSLRLDSDNCDWYSACMSLATTGSLVMAAQAATCDAPGNNSGTFTLSQYASNADVWIDYTGTASSISADYSNYPNSLVTGTGHFRITTNRADVASELCSTGTAPATAQPADTIKLHFRWMWGNPDKTGFPGTSCENFTGTNGLGVTTPPYPTSLKVTFGSGCQTATALLELQNNDCPWYTVYVPTSVWNTPGQTITVAYNGNNQGALSGMPLSPIPATQSEYWLAYAGPPLDRLIGGQGGDCNNRFGKEVTHFYPQNPGPGYQGCGGGDVKIDPCSPPAPVNYSTVHFRYIWAGQKTFTYFPKPDFMPKWIQLTVNSPNAKPAPGATSAMTVDPVICFREADRPWFNCQVPNEMFAPGASWIAADLTRMPTEWNTVEGHPFPTTPGEYWIRWTYGKPDFNDALAPWEKDEKYTIYTFYPDGIGGDLSATGSWGDQACAPRPASNTSMHLGFDGWFPYDETNYVYPYGASLAVTYPAPSIVQQLLNYIVQERYLLWRKHYVETADDPLGLGAQAALCGADTARVVYRDRQNVTFSEGQGYGMAISAAIGDKPTFDKLWNFARHYLSTSAKKYCGGLMGWQWNADGSTACRALDVPCDPDKDTTCSGIHDSAFDGDVDIAIGLVTAAMQWPEYRNAAISWLLKMECEIDTVYDGKWFYPSNGDTWDKNCQNYPNGPCTYAAGQQISLHMDYYPPGYFRVFGDFLEKYMDPAKSTANERATHKALWYKTASTVYELYERAYDDTATHPALIMPSGSNVAPSSGGDGGNYEWPRFGWRLGIDAAWFGNRQDFVENAAGSSRHYNGKSEMQAKIDLLQDYYANFYKNNPVEANANRFSSLCDDMMPDGKKTGCDPGKGHNSVFVNAPLCAYASIFDNDGKTTGDLRRAALEEAVSTSIQNNRVYQESIGVHTLMFMTGNLPNPMTVAK